MRSCKIAVILLLCVCAGLPVRAQLISTTRHIGAEAQLMLHLDGLESSWEVMQARALAENKGQTQGGDAPLPTDAQLTTGLRNLKSEIALEVNDKVKDFIELFAHKRSSSTEAMMGVAGVYAPVIERKIIELRLPPILEYFPAALSAFNARAVAADGCTGLWQLNYYTAVRYGLHCDATVDERRDLYKSTKAALTYLADLYKLYNDWPTAIVAYSCGPGSIAKARLRAGNKANIAQLYPYLPDNARDRLPAFVAAAYVMTHPVQLQLKALAMEVMALPDRIQLQEPLKFTHVANVLGIPENQLRQMNPVCRTEIIPGIGLPVQLCLPKGYGQRFSELKDSIYHLQIRDNAAAKAAEAKLAAKSAASSGDEPNEAPKPKPEFVKPEPPKPYAPPAGYEKLVYTIKSGDNVGSIARWYGITVKELREQNKMSSDRITAGHTLTVYVPKANAAKLAKVEAMTFDEKQAMIGANTTTATVTPKVNVPVGPQLPAPKPDYVWHTVKSGENLWVIAKKYPGVSAEAIMKANGISEKLQIGQKIKIPKAQK
jgi:membrane-bound lytic murein transglycosylase D